MRKHIQALTNRISKNKSAWLMGILNVIASVIIAGGGIDIAHNKTQISNGVNNIAVLHKRISVLENESKDRDAKNEIELAKISAQFTWLKDYTEKNKTELREDIRNISRRLDSISRK
jgi:hypothetical protein